MKRIFIFILIAYFLAMIESGLIANFSLFINLLLLYAILFNLIENPKKEEGLIVSAFCGLFFDIFSSFVFGFYTMIFLVSSIILKLILKKYVRLPVFSQ